MLLELRLRRRPPDPQNSPVDGIRILAMLPLQWRKDLRRESGDVIVGVHLDEQITDELVHTEITRALADPSIGNWELVASRFAAEAAEEGKRR